MLHLNLLQAARGLADVLGDVETFGCVDLGVDQPLLKLSVGRAEPLFLQLLFALALSGGLEAQTGDQSNTYSRYMTPDPERYTTLLRTDSEGKNNETTSSLPSYLLYSLMREETLSDCVPMSRENRHRSLS